VTDNPSVTVAASGNWLLGHDRIGPQVLELIRGRYDSTVELCDLGSGALALLDVLSAQDLLVVVDACIGIAEPGEVLVTEPELCRDLGRETSVHQIGPIEALVIAHHLYPELLPQRIKLVLVETGNLDEAGEDRVCREVVDVLDRELGSYAQLAANAPATRGGFRGCSTRA
jgi:hydrogenase maturation protease